MPSLDQQPDPAPLLLGLVTAICGAAFFVLTALSARPLAILAIGVPLPALMLFLIGIALSRKISPSAAFMAVCFGMLPTAHLAYFIHTGWPRVDIGRVAAAASVVLAQSLALYAGIRAGRAESHWEKDEGVRCRRCGYELAGLVGIDVAPNADDLSGVDPTTVRSRSRVQADVPSSKACQANVC